ncbi:AI-2E family transporter [Streptomyces zingiberis]|uniref:AI-2E family transporter n=1 Tax=Streptomyces zingiberis TaxID=2053010 RepID=A0ABX1BRZ8_9ACTN|nr:AI-2E family transporter [Streptomyces zingiberis]NJQ00510.1 AI-2E family transporter [Streptomyces zingiberis]
MSRLPDWLGGVGSGLTKIAARMNERRARAEERAAEAGEADAAAYDDGDGGAGGPSGAGPGAGRSGARSGTLVPPPPAYAPSVAARREPADSVPWSMRVASEVGWRLLVLAGTLWVAMQVISTVRLVVFSFVIGLLITALLQPTVAMLRRRGVPRGPATALTFVGGIVFMGLIGWFVVWQVMENIDNLSSQLQDGIQELKRWLLNSPFHVTEEQINQIAQNLSDAVGSNTEAITSAGLQGVTVVIEVASGLALAMFSALFLLYDGRKIWDWLLKLMPASARDGVAGAGPRAWLTLTAYVRGTVVVALIDAIFIGIGIYFLGVPMAVPLAVIIFLSAFVPLVGAVVSGALAVIVAIVTNGVFTALWVLVVVLAVQQIEGHVLQPLILGRAVRVHPLAVVLAVTAGGLVAGIGGAVVAVPLVAVVNTVVGYLYRHAERQAAARAEGVGPTVTVPAAVAAASAAASSAASASGSAAVPSSTTSSAPAPAPDDEPRGGPSAPPGTRPGAEAPDGTAGEPGATGSGPGAGPAPDGPRPPEPPDRPAG